MHRHIAKAVLGTLIVAGSCFGWAAASGAATPVIHACVGTTFSQAAHQAHPLGQLIKGFAQDPESPPGLGDGIQAVQAGAVPDDVAVNTCNG